MFKVLGLFNQLAHRPAGVGCLPFDKPCKWNVGSISLRNANVVLRLLAWCSCATPCVIDLASWILRVASDCVASAGDKMVFNSWIRLLLLIWLLDLARAFRLLSGCWRQDGIQFLESSLVLADWVGLDLVYFVPPLAVLAIVLNGLR